MKLTPLQRKALIRYNTFRHQPMDWTEVYAKALPPLLIIGTIAGLSAFVIPTAVATLFAGVGLGATLRQIAIMRRTAQILPAILAVIDWSRVAALLGESAPNPASPPSSRGD